MNDCDKEFRFNVKVSLSDATNALEASQIRATHNLGGCIIHHLLHPVFGEFFLVNTDGGESIFLK